MWDEVFRRPGEAGCTRPERARLVGMRDEWRNGNRSGRRWFHLEIPIASGGLLKALALNVHGERSLNHEGDAGRPGGIDEL